MKPSSQQIEVAFKSYLSQNPLAKQIKTDDTLLVTDDGKLGVNTAKFVQPDNKYPVTADAVHTRIGTINVRRSIEGE